MIYLIQFSNYNLEQKELLHTKEYVGLKYATLEESDTLLQMKLKAHRLTLTEEDDE